MQAQQALVTFTEAERPLADRLLKLAAEIDRIEGYSEPHAIAIARMAETLGARMGLHGSDLAALKFAALAHDIGERSMKRNYLLRPDALTWEETLDMWRHPILGEQAAVELRLPRQAQLLIRWHHESWNGLGYPDGLSVEAIPLGARILRAVDGYYALISRRPHRAPHDPLDAEQIIADLAGIEFDPRVVKSLLMALAEERKEREAREALLWPQPFAAAVPELTPVFLVDADAVDEPAVHPEQAIEPAIDEPLAYLLEASPREPAPAELPEASAVPDSEPFELTIDEEWSASPPPPPDSQAPTMEPVETLLPVPDIQEFDVPVVPDPVELAVPALQPAEAPAISPDTQPEPNPSIKQFGEQ